MDVLSSIKEAFARFEAAVQAVKDANVAKDTVIADLNAQIVVLKASSVSSADIQAVADTINTATTALTNG